MPGASVPVKNVSHVGIYVSDIDRSVAFYRRVFGFEVLFDEKIEGPALERITGVRGAGGRAVGGRIGDVRVELLHLDTVPAVARPPGLGLSVLSLEVADADAAHAAVLRLGERCDTPVVEHYGTRMFFVSDPDGQRIELVEYVRGGPAWGGAYR
jgi:catechol 2,3-dioxygenase-like lactoylglutathione lyase family enzyme